VTRRRPLANNPGVPNDTELQALYAVLQAQRARLGDAVVDFALTALRAHAAAAPGAGGGAPRLRQVSVLFCDIVGSTAMLQRLDAEDALSVVGQALRRFGTLVEAAGGRVLRYTGDGLKAAFGSEHTREDDAQRAVQAGLAIVAAARAHALQLRAALTVDDFAVRVGINTGDVVLGGGVEADHSAMGHAVHVAARLEQAAPAGQLLIGARTWDLVRGQFDAQAQPPLTVKGVDEPLPSWIVLRERTRADRDSGRGVAGLATPLVGRDADLQRLRAVVQRAVDSHAPQAATVLADAGVGKSRLAQELLGALAVDGVDVQVWSAAAQASGRLQPYGLLRELVAQHCGLADDEPAESARHKVVHTLAPLIGTRGEVQARLLGRLLGLDFPDDAQAPAPSGRELREQGLRALRRVLAGAAQQRPLLLLLDDLHWADDGSLDFIASLLTTPPDAPVALVALARPTLLEHCGDWPPADARHDRLALATLDAQAGADLARALLRNVPDPPAALQHLLVQRAEGNPFYMEELLRMLIDDGVIVAGPGAWRVLPDRLARARVPGTLVGVLQARLDALPPPARHALQQASVIGPVFWVEALAELDTSAAQALALLAERRFVAPREPSAFDGCREYRFHHALLHEVTYGTLFKAERRRGHGRVARWLAQRVGERASEFVAVTAEHFERAGDSPRALDHFERAAHQAADRFAHSALAVYCERALAQPALTDARRRYRLLESQVRATDALGHSDLSDRLLQAQQALAEQLDDDALRADTAAQRALWADRTGDEARAAAAAAEAVRLGERCGVATAVVLGHGELAWLAVCRGDHAAAQPHLESGLEWACRVAPSDGDPRPAASYERMLRLIRVESLLKQYRLADAADEVARLLALALPYNTLDRANLLQRQGMLARNLGDLDAAWRHHSECLAVSTEAEVGRLIAAAHIDLAIVAQAQGRLDEAAQLTARGLAQALASHAALGVTNAHLQQAELQLARGAWAEAAQGAEQAAQESDALGQPPLGASARALAALAHWHGGRADSARRTVDAALALPEPLPETRLRAWRVLDALGDARAAVLKQSLDDELQRLLNSLPDAAARERVLRHAPVWSELGASAMRPVFAR